MIAVRIKLDKQGTQSSNILSYSGTKWEYSVIEAIF